MRQLSNQAILGSAAGVLIVGTAWAGSIYMRPVKYDGPNTTQIRQLAARVQEDPAEERPLTFIAPPRTQRLVVDTTPDKTRKSTSSTSTQRVTTRPQTPETAPAPSEPEDPVKNIALMGVTRDGETEEAWLVDISDSSRETVPEGGSAWGFTVREIHPESVILARGDDSFTLRLGEKQIPVVESSADTGSFSGGSGFDSPFGEFGRGRGRGGSDSDRDRIRQMMRERFAAMRGGSSSGRSWGGSSSGFSGRSWGGSSDSGRSWGGRGSDSGSSRWSSSSSGSDRRSRGGFSSSGFSGSGFSGRGFSGGFGGGGFGGGGFNSSMNGMATSQFSSGGNSMSSNPQTARRRGGRLVGSAVPAIEEPDPIRNPQTRRRSGSNSSRAFGQPQQQYGSSQFGRGGSSFGR